MAHTHEEIKALGAFYTPPILADLLARLVFPLYNNQNHQPVTILDPATGGSILLYSISNIARLNENDYHFVGIDVDSSAIISSAKLFKEKQGASCFINTDGLYPLNADTPSVGWDLFKQQYIPNGIDIIVSNPPWGADLSKYTSLSNHFITAKGQFDIYDLFVETIINNLKQDGAFGLIVPDSIYCQEHQSVRKILLKTTTIIGIIRLGEGFFPDVNFAASIIYGIKRTPNNYSIECSHLTNTDKKEILAGIANIFDVVKRKSTKIPVKQMIDSNFSFNIDVLQSDLDLINKLRKHDTLRQYADCQRGVELSKKGNVYLCPDCNMWFPEPRKKGNIIKCPHCKVLVDKSIAHCTCIIDKVRTPNSVPMLAGEDIGRYFVSCDKFINLGYNGINYKPMALYQGAKVVVRKTGVGITAGIDYQNSLANQVVYIYKPKACANPLITPEVITAVLCSRLITYVIIKEKGSIGWTSNPYLSQSDVNNIPFPRIDYNESKVVAALRLITKLVKEHSQSHKNLPSAIDAEIERCVAFLFQITEEEYDMVFKTIHEVEQMIPFRRLLDINTKTIFHYGI